MQSMHHMKKTLQDFWSNFWLSGRAKTIITSPNSTYIVFAINFDKIWCTVLGGTCRAAWSLRIRRRGSFWNNNHTCLTLWFHILGLLLPPLWPRLSLSKRFSCQRRISSLRRGVLNRTRRIYLFMVVKDTFRWNSSKIWSFPWGKKGISTKKLICVYHTREGFADQLDYTKTEAQKYSLSTENFNLVNWWFHLSQRKWGIEFVEIYSKNNINTVRARNDSFSWSWKPKIGRKNLEMFFSCDVSIA